MNIDLGLKKGVFSDKNKMIIYRPSDSSWLHNAVRNNLKINLPDYESFFPPLPAAQA